MSLVTAMVTVSALWSSVSFAGHGTVTCVKQLNNSRLVVGDKFNLVVSKCRAVSMEQFYCYLKVADGEIFLQVDDPTLRNMLMNPGLQQVEINDVTYNGNMSGVYKFTFEL